LRGHFEAEEERGKERKETCGRDGRNPPSNKFLFTAVTDDAETG